MLYLRQGVSSGNRQPTLHQFPHIHSTPQLSVSRINTHKPLFTLAYPHEDLRCCFTMPNWKDEYLGSLKDVELRNPVNMELVQACQYHPPLTPPHYESR